MQRFLELDAGPGLEHIICPIVAECNNVPGVMDTFTCVIHGEYVKIPSRSDLIMRIFEKEAWKI